jgi:hypothetical protein
MKKKKPVFILDAGPNTVVGTRAKVLDAVKGGHLKFAYADKRPHSDVPFSTLVLSFVVEDGDAPHCVRGKDRLWRFSDRQQFKSLRPDVYASGGTA